MLKRHPQAMAELLIILIPMLLIFLGMWYVSAVGLDKLNLLITSRGKSETLATGSYGIGSRSDILKWDYGADNIPFTPDDRCFTDGNINAYTTYMNALRKGDIAPDDITKYLNNNMSKHAVVSLFATGADLMEYQGRQRPLKDQPGREKLFESFSILFNANGEQDIVETVFTPTYNNMQ